MSLLEEIDRTGFAIVDDVLSAATVAEVISATVASGCSSNLRDLTTTMPEVLRLCSMNCLRSLAEQVLGAGAFMVRSLLFDKNPAANRKVAWHQDLTIAVRERREIAGYGPWSVKAGIQHVQPPAAVLEHMITLRLHLDDCGAKNGALKVLPASHLAGKLTNAEIQRLSGKFSPTTCVVRRGGVLLMRPLLLHSSDRVEQPEHRRVIHLEFAAQDLPGGLGWFETNRSKNGN